MRRFVLSLIGLVWLGPASAQLNISISTFDPGIPEDYSLHRDLQVFPKIREIESMFLPFVLRHIALAKPRLLMTMGNTPTKALLDTTTGIKRLRGKWIDHHATGLRLLPTFHPAYLLRQPAEKKFAWQDLLELKSALEGNAV